MYTTMPSRLSTQLTSRNPHILSVKSRILITICKYRPRWSNFCCHVMLCSAGRSLLAQTSIVAGWGTVQYRTKSFEITPHFHLFSYKGKVVPVQAMKTYWKTGGMTPLILNDECPTLHTGRVTTGEEPSYPLNRILDGPHRRYRQVLGEKTPLPLPGSKPRTVQPIARSLWACSLDDI